MALMASDLGRDARIALHDRDIADNVADAARNGVVELVGRGLPVVGLVHDEDIENGVDEGG